jgi:hypothetical protein
LPLYCKGMAVRHGTRYGYKGGCRCDECRAAQAAYQARYRDRVLNGPPVAPELQAAGPGPVEVATRVELAGLSQAELQPGLAAIALCMGRVLDHPRAHSSKPAAAKQLADILDRLRQASLQGRPGALKLVRQMSDPRPSEPAKPPVGT